MLKVTVELLSARTGSQKVLSTAYIANTGDGDEEAGNYVAQILKGDYSVS